MTVLKGIGGSRGYGSGAATVKKPASPVAVKLPIADAGAEIRRFRRAQATYAEYLRTLAKDPGGSAGRVVSEIFGAYDSIVHDEDFLDIVIGRVKKEHVCIDYILYEESRKLISLFATMKDDYMRERASDIENVTTEIINIMNGAGDRFPVMPPDRLGHVLVAENLTPAEMLRLEGQAMRGIVTQHGGVTSHIVILAKALGIPAIVGVPQAAEEIKDGDFLQLDAFTGKVEVNPDAESRKHYAMLETAYKEERRRSEEAAFGPAFTLDGHRVRVLVNTGDAASLRSFSPEACDGIGLFRTEFVYLNSDGYPDEEAQFKIYKNAVVRARGKEVVFRTVDVGADKAAGYMNLPNEENPLLGYRAIRVCIDNPAMFGAQLRAILRASAFVRIMFPMIVTLQELRDAKLCLENEKQSLRDRHIPFDENIPVGIMIETPAAVMISDRLAPESAFFSVGTNDLIQYATASDRMNERTHHLFDPCDPAVLRMLLMVAENAAAAHIPWGVCGEAAGEERLAPLWVAMGAGHLSVSPGSVGAVKRVIGAVSHESAKEWLGSVMLLESGGEVNAYYDNILNRMLFREFSFGL